MTVCKFGGSSLSSKESFEIVKDVISKRCERKIVVVSALGKNANYGEKITDKLINCFEKNKLGVNVKTEFEEIASRYLELSCKLGCNSLNKQAFTYLYGELLNGAPYDYFVSRGEYFSAKLLAEYIGYEFVDAKDLIVYRGDFTVNSKLIKNKKVVVSGFYANDGNGNVKLFNRGGSDLTGSLLAKCVGELYENWTDVDGIKEINPKISNGKTVKEMGYEQLYLLSEGGANVFSKDAVLPLIDGKLTTHIRNTFNYNGEFTRVYGKTVKTDGLIAVADKPVCKGKTELTVITGGIKHKVKGLNLLWQNDFCAKIQVEDKEVKFAIEKIKEEYDERYR